MKIFYHEAPAVTGWLIWWLIVERSLRLSRDRHVALKSCLSLYSYSFVLVKVINLFCLQNKVQVVVKHLLNVLPVAFVQVLILF